MTPPAAESPADLPEVIEAALEPLIGPPLDGSDAASAATRNAERVLLHMPVDVRSASLVVIAVLAVVFALQWASAVFIPLMVSGLLTYALAPLVTRLERFKISRWIGAALILVALGGVMAWTAYSLAGSALQLVDSLPVAAQKLRVQMRQGAAARSGTPLESVQLAASQLERAAEENSTRVTSRTGATRVVIERPSFNVRDYMWTGTVGLLAALGQLTLVVFLTFFALGSGDTFRRKLVKITGPSLEKKKITLHMLDDVSKQVERYLLVQIFTSALVGVATGLSFWALGLSNAAVWGILAAVANLIPYIGSVIVLGAAGLVAFLQFNSIQMAMVIGGVSLMIHTLVGNLLLPFLTSRTSRMNPLAVFVGVIFWGWLWGVWGLLLGIPIMMVFKAICDRVEDLEPIGELLGD